MIVNVLILVFSRPFIAILSRLLDVPYSVLGPIIVICCIVGTYSVQNSMMDVWLMLGFGVAGFLLEKIGFPLVSIILGVVLGPIAESELRRSLAMTQGDLSVFWTRPISAILLAIAIALVVMTVVMPLVRRRKADKDELRDA
ncbi:tripartite tricarboxylate transporter permease [Tranquillimonas rosea]|uniref:tripartite tricarboxylate transporter permease n=1 Tax=Tranquillimonas rosea TaxID=641238 RepID=UPI003BAC584A